MSAALDRTLVDLLGDTRAEVVRTLRGSARTVAELADEVGVSEVAVRRHLQVLERDGLVSAETVRRDGPGRPSAYYTLTERARRLFPDNSAALANELLDFLEDEHGRRGLLAFLRWRQARHGQRYAAVQAPEDGDDGDIDPALAERVERLAELLTEDGFPSSVTAVTAPDGATVLELRQEHCAIADVAAEHPELCAYEAALFRQVLGAKVSRRQTIAGGATACVCSVRPAANDAAAQPQDVQTITTRERRHVDQS